MIRFTVTKREVHLNVGWRWLIYDQELHDLVDGCEFTDRAESERVCARMNGGAA